MQKKDVMRKTNERMRKRNAYINERKAKGKEKLDRKGKEHD